MRDSRRFPSRVIRLALVAFVVVAVRSSLVAAPASAESPGACRSVLLGGNSWLNGAGVDVYSNGEDEGTGASCDGGDDYQCVELINRLYLTKGWIRSTWSGNGGRSSPSARDSMWDEAPDDLSKQANGSISYVGPGDVVSVNVYDGSMFEPDGHVLVVNTSGDTTNGTVSLVSENGGDRSNATPKITATLSNGTLTIPDSGDWSYPVIGVVHAPSTAEAEPYAIGTSGAGALTLRYTTSKAVIWSSSGQDEVADVTTPLVLGITITGPAHGSGVRKLVIDLDDVGCDRDCQNRTWQIRVAPLGARGLEHLEVVTPLWGCGHPVVRAHLLLVDGKTSSPVRWEPNTVCGE